MKTPDFSQYLDYKDLVATFSELVDANPKIAKKYSIGKTYEGRDIWAVEITNYEVGCPDKKPAMYIDGNHHAGEVTGSAVCLYTIWYLFKNYGTDPLVTELIDNCTWYILPRISADGAEIFLHTPYNLRSSVREYPPRDNFDGLNSEDIDGDGLILQMRIPADDGDWKVSQNDDRLMVRREAWDKEGPFYKVYPEGILKNWDGGEIKMAPSKWGLDINRNYPAFWAPEHVQRGAGPYPLSEPETRAVADFILSKPNIVGAMSYHTTMGAILRPACTRPDSKLPPADVNLYKVIGQKGTDLTSYPAISTYEDYTADKANPMKGIFMDWLYEHLGIITFSTELWDASVRAGNDLFNRRGQGTEQGQLNMLKWNDRELAGKGFERWRKFDHPQLGEVEIGGWKSKYVLTNPPNNFLEGECHKNCLFTIYEAASLPKVKIDKAEVETLGEGLYKVKVVVANEGFMPTSGTQQAVIVGKAKPVSVKIAGDEALSLVVGKPKVEIGHIPGLSGSGRGFFFMGGGGGGGKKEVEWVLKATPGSTATLTVASERAGTVTKEICFE